MTIHFSHLLRMFSVSW